jgi:uncharacterized membrane protein YfcA
MEINWLKVLIAPLLMQLPVIPFFWKGYLPFEERTAYRIGIVSKVLVGPMYALIFWALDVSMHEAILICMLFMILAGIQAVFFVLTYQRKKTPLRRIAPTVILGLTALVLAALGIFFLEVRQMPVIGMLFLACVILIAIGTTAKLQRRDRREKQP